MHKTQPDSGSWEDPSLHRSVGHPCSLTNSLPTITQEDLCRHLEVLEERLAGHEQAGLEKELLYEQVCRLADRAQIRVTAHRDSTLQACLSSVPYILLFLCTVCVGGPACQPVPEQD